MLINLAREKKNTVNICECSGCYIYCGDSLCCVEALFRNIYYKIYFHLRNNGCIRMEEQ